MSDSRHDEPNLAPSDVKRSHYVPQFYLRPFADGDEQIRVVHVDSGASEYRTHVKNVAVESRFYEVVVDGETLSTETWLSSLEGLAKPVLDKLIGDPGSVASLTSREQNDLARFLAAFRFRTPIFREQNESLKQQMVAFAKDLMGNYVRNTLPKEEAHRQLREWEDEPDEFWLANAAPGPPAETTAVMLGRGSGLG